jgi:methionyl-tRNA formyltransferase
MPIKLNFVFFGTPDVGSETLEILKGHGFLPSLIITSPDKPQGRKMLITPPPVKTWAIENGIPYMQPEKLDEEFYKNLKNIACDLSIVVAYGKILPEAILKIPKLGSVNIHYSLLPKYRGASPVESAILNGETETGVTIQKMEFEMDSGPIIAQEIVRILPDEKAPELRKRLINIGGELLVKILPEFIDNKINLIPQDEKAATFCKKIKKEDGLVDIEKEQPVILYNKFRAYSHWPRIFFIKNDPTKNKTSKRVIITDAALEDGNFIIKKVLPEGKKEINYQDFLRQV